MGPVCDICSSNRLRISHLRRGDFFALIFLHVPVRCTECMTRRFVWLPTGLWIWIQQRARHRHRVRHEHHLW